MNSEAPSTGLSERTPASFEQPPAEDYPDLANLLRVSEQIYSGGQPDGEASFEQLAKLGVKVVVSVDGARPDVETADKHGLRYVHIPIGYDRISQQAGALLSRLVRDYEGPFYLHCHHERHRGPAAAAAAVASIAAGTENGTTALEILERAGTSKHYAGLWRDVAAYSPPPPDVELPELVAVAEVDSLTAAMAGIDRSYDHLKWSHDAEWSVPPEHPDLVPAQEALLIREGFHEIARLLDEEFDDEFRQRLRTSEQIARTLESALAVGNHEEAPRLFVSLDGSCKQCHTKYRD